MHLLGRGLHLIFRRRDGSSSGPLRLVKTRALAFGEIRVYIRTDRKGLPLPKRGVTHLAPGATGHMEDDFFDLPGLADGSSDSSDSDEDDGGSTVRSRREKWRRHQEQIRADGDQLFGRAGAEPQHQLSNGSDWYDQGRFGHLWEHESTRVQAPGCAECPPLIFI